MPSQNGAKFVTLGEGMPFTRSTGPGACDKAAVRALKTHLRDVLWVAFDDAIR